MSTTAFLISVCPSRKSLNLRVVVGALDTEGKPRICYLMMGRKDLASRLLHFDLEQLASFCSTSLLPTSLPTIPRLPLFSQCQAECSKSEM